MPELCQEVLQFSEKSTSHDAVTATGSISFARDCRLVAAAKCADCGISVCTHHRYARHEGHAVAEVEA